MSRLLTHWNSIPGKPGFKTIGGQSIFGSGDIAVSDSSKVPYTGATQGLNMGLYDLQATKLIANNPSEIGPSPYLSAVNSFSEATLELRNSQTDAYTNMNLGSMVASGTVSAGSLTASGNINTGFLNATPEQSNIAGTKLGSTGNGPWIRGSGASYTVSRKNSQTSASLYFYSFGNETVQVYGRLGIGGIVQSPQSFLTAASNTLSLWQSDGTTPGSLNLANLTASGNIMPSVHNTSDLGSSEVRFKTGYFATGVTAAGQSNFATVNTANLITSGSVTFNRTSTESYGVYAQGKNASGYVDWELNEGRTGGSGGSLTLRAGDLANTGNIRLRYDSGYPKISTTASNFTVSTIGHDQVWASTYITQGIGGNTYYDAQSTGSYANLFRSYAAGQATLVARGPVSQTGNLFEAQNSTGTAVLSVSPSGNSRFNNGVLQGGLVLRQFESNNGGWSNYEIAGPNFGVGTGLQFFNHVPEIRAASTFRAIGSFGASLGVFGSTGGPTTIEDSVRLSASSGTAYLYTMRYASSPYPPLHVSGSSIVLRTGAGAWPSGAGWGTAALSIDASQNTTLAGSLTCGVVTSTFRSLSADPTTLEITAGQSQLVKNTTSGEIRLWVNDGGVMKKSAALT